MGWNKTIMNKIKTFNEFCDIIDSNITTNYIIEFLESNSSALDKDQNEVNYSAIFNGLAFYIDYFNGDNYDKPEVNFNISWNHFTKYKYDDLEELKLFIEQVQQILKELEG